MLVVAALVGWGFGSWLGNLGGPSASPAEIPSTVPRMTASPSASPTLGPAPSSEASLPSGTLVDLSGSGDVVTPSFDALAGWQIVWQTEGGGFALAVRGDQDLGTIVNQPETASGATSISSHGTFYIEVTAKGKWSMKVLQGEEPTPSPSASPAPS
jgi:hypothetical protein